MRYAPIKDQEDYTMKHRQVKWMSEDYCLEMIAGLKKSIEKYRSCTKKTAHLKKDGISYCINRINFYLDFYQKLIDKAA